MNTELAPHQTTPAPLLGVLHATPDLASPAHGSTTPSRCIELP